MLTSPFGGNDLPLMTPLYGNRQSGRGEFNKYKLNSGYWSAQLFTDDPCSGNDNDYFVTGDFHGDGLDVFNVDYDEIFSPYSNPSTNSCQSPTGNTDLTITLTGASHGVIDVRIYFDDDDAVSDLPPSKPKNFLVSKEYIATGKFNPKLTWDSNIEPDFYNEEDGGEYKILRGSTSNCESEPSFYNLIQVVEFDENEYVDESVDLYDAGAGSHSCEYEYLTIHYKIIAVDKDNYESLPSEKSKVSGWQDPCAPEDRPMPDLGIPTEFALNQNYPNPFNPSTNIQFDLPKDVFVSIKVYDIAGREMAILINDFKNAGRYIVAFNGSQFASGIYFYTIKAGDFEVTKRMVLVK